MPTKFNMIHLALHNRYQSFWWSCCKSFQEDNTGSDDIVGDDVKLSRNWPPMQNFAKSSWFLLVWQTSLNYFLVPWSNIPQLQMIEIPLILLLCGGSICCKHISPMQK